MDDTQFLSQSIKRIVVLSLSAVCTFQPRVTPLLCHWSWKDFGKRLRLRVSAHRTSGSRLTAPLSHLEMHFKDWNILQDGVLRSILRSQAGGLRHKRSEESHRSVLSKHFHSLCSLFFCLTVFYVQLVYVNVGTCVLAYGWLHIE